MSGLLAALGSLWLAAVVLMLLLVAMACATVFESIRGTEQALAGFYRSWWFELLLAILAVNIFAAVALRYPFSKRQVGFVLTHAGILVTLAGAVVTKVWGVDGQVGIAEGQTVEHFNVNQDTLTVVNRLDHTRSTIDLDAPAFGGFQVVEGPEAPLLSLDNLQVEVERYLPDGVRSKRVSNDNPLEHAAVEVSLSESGRDHPTWIFAGQTAMLGSKSAAFRLVSDSEQMARLLDGTSAGEPASADVIKVEYGGSPFEVPLADCTDQAVPLGDTGYAVRLLRYLPHAVVGPDNRVTNASNRPVNPAVEVEVVGPQRSEKRLAFAKFPDFRSMHEEEHTEGLKLTFLAGVGDMPEAAVEMFGGPEDEMCVRFSWEGAEPLTRRLTVGAPVESPWPGRRFAVLRRFDHARVEWSVAPADPIRKDREPMILVKWKTAQDSGDMWLQKYQAQLLPVEDRSYELVYGDKAVPLGFALTLERFRVGYYPGGGKPRSFESHVTVTDPTTGSKRSRIISMNNPTEYAGGSLFQSSYRTDGSQSVSFLSVSRDPGQPIVFAGYIAVLTGMVLVLGTRMVDRHRRNRIAEWGSEIADRTP